MMTEGELAASRLAAIAKASEPGEGVTRLPWTPPHAAALDHIRDWMDDAGLVPEMDAAGTLRGRMPGAVDKPVLLLGSHQDSVRCGGRFDGIMGVALACLAVRRFRDRAETLPFALEVLAFADEEGVRFPTALIGPRALAGTLDPAVFAMEDRDGTTMGAAMRAFGADPARTAGLARRPEDVVGFIEAHIEQGPVLEDRGLAIGVVSGICGISRLEIRVTGETGHAGTVPMAGRRDALVGAARMIDAIHREALAHPGLRATVGALRVSPGVVNAIPSDVRMTVETRSTDDAGRAAFNDWVGRMADDMAQPLGLVAHTTPSYDQPAVACDRDLSAALFEGARTAGHPTMELPSGATHDASAMADLCPVAMLFVRCAGGISHRPDEYAGAADMAAAVDVLAGAIGALASPRV